MKSIEFYIRVKQPVIKWVTDDEGIHHIVETGEYTEELELRRMPYTEANEAIAKSEAYNGEYTIEDDGQPDPSETPTQLDRIEAQTTYTAMMTDTLLEV